MPRSHSARPFFDRALEQDPDLLRKKHEVAVDLSRNGQYDKAAELLREILVVAPDHARTLFELGAVLLKAGRSAEAVGYIEAGLDIQPNRSAETMLAEARRSATAPAPAPASSSTRMVQHAR